MRAKEFCFVKYLYTFIDPFKKSHNSKPSKMKGAQNKSKRVVK